jgi:dihydrofolate reductase
MISIVVAMGRNHLIGRNGDLPWRISDDLKWFRKVTMGKPIIMGRKTYDSIGKPLPGRRNIVITRNAGFGACGIDVASSIDAALDLARSGDQPEICIIGGAAIYRETLDLADRIYLTLVDAEPEGDAFFPALDWSAWRKSPMGGATKSPKNEYSCEFFMLDRVSPLI